MPSALPRVRITPHPLTTRKRLFRSRWRNTSPPLIVGCRCSSGGIHQGRPLSGRSEGAFCVGASRVGVSPQALLPASSTVTPHTATLSEWLNFPLYHPKAISLPIPDHAFQMLRRTRIIRDIPGSPCEIGNALRQLNQNITRRTSIPFAHGTFLRAHAAVRYTGVRTWQMSVADRFAIAIGRGQVVRQWTLDPRSQVRILAPEPVSSTYSSHSPASERRDEPNIVVTRKELLGWL